MVRLAKMVAPMAAGDPEGRHERTVGDLSARHTIWNKK
jgi:hypothetical protein